MKTVYISYLSDNIVDTVNIHKVTIDNLIQHEFIPYSPIVSYLYQNMYKKNLDQWDNINFYWLSKCNCILHYSSNNSRTDNEILKAKELNIPIFTSIGDVLSYFKNKEIL